MTRQEIAKVLEKPYEAFSPDLCALHIEGAVRLSEIMAPADLLVYDNYNALAIGWTFNGNTGGVAIGLPMWARAIRLGFNRGAVLHDPEGRLEGQGSTFRSIVFTSPELLEDPYVRGLIDQAIANAPKGPCAGRVVLKSESPVKRR